MVGPSRWLRDTAIGYWRSAVLVAVAGLIPALTVAVAVFGLSFSRSWSAHLHAPLLVRLVAAIGEWALAALWTAAGFGVAMAVLGRPTAQFLRRYGGHWLGAEIPSPYRPPRPITKMSTGYWWNGHGYHETERQAKIEAWFMDRSLLAIRSADSDPQLRRDVVWQAVAAATVVPVAALPLLAGAGAIYAATAPSRCCGWRCSPWPAWPPPHSPGGVSLPSRGPVPRTEPERHGRRAGSSAELHPGRPHPDPGRRTGTNRAQPPRRCPGPHGGPGHALERGGAAC